MELFLQDLRHAFRNLVRQPGFAIAAALMLALGIGATTAIFSVVNAIVLRPLPLREPDRIVAVMTLWTQTGQRGATASAPDFYDWQDQNRSFAALSSFAGGETSVSVGGVADYAAVYAATPGFFTVLGAGAQAGRLPSESEERPGGNLTAVITDAFWRRRFNADPRALGTTLKFSGAIYTIVGILPPRVRYPAGADIYTPAWALGATREAAAHRGAHNFRVVGRLRDGVSVEQANADMVAIARRLEQAYPNSNANKSVLVVPLQESLVGDSRQTLYVLLAAVVLVLLIACANVANLLLARASVREREMVVRAAVGAGRGRLIRQLLTESIALAVIAGIAGAMLARLGVAAVVALAPPELPRLDEIAVDTTALGFALVISIGSSVFFGLAPAVQVSRVHLVDGLRQGGKGSALGARGGRARNAFVVAEIALAVVLVVGAALLGRSLVALAEVDLGFSPERLLVIRTAVPTSGMADAPRATAFYRDVLPELRALPGVTAAGAVTSLPTAVRSNGGYWIDGGPGPNDTGVSAPQAIFNVISPEYFRTMRIPLTRGRDFSDRDRRDAPFVAIVNEALVREAFAGGDPIGRRIQCGLDTLEFMTIVGVVADVRTRGPARPVQPEIYMPYEQHPGPATAMTIVARTAVADPLALAEAMRRKIRDRNPEVPARADTMEMTLDHASATPRFRTFLLALFAATALVLALSGVYGVMAYTVSQRVPEIGVRMALGAGPGDILRMIVAQGAKLAGIGLGLGTALALAASRVIEGLLFGVTARDPVIFAAVAVVTSAAVLGACYVPSRRAVRVEPMTALRSE